MKERALVQYTIRGIPPEVDRVYSVKSLVDEVAVYNRALSAAELKGMAGTCSAAN